MFKLEICLSAAKCVTMLLEMCFWVNIFKRWMWRCCMITQREVLNYCSSLLPGVAAASLVHLTLPCASIPHPADMNWILLLPCSEPFNDFSLYLEINGEIPKLFPMLMNVCPPGPCQLFWSHFLSLPYPTSHSRHIISFLVSLHLQAFPCPWAWLNSHLLGDPFPYFSS